MRPKVVSVEPRRWEKLPPTTRLLPVCGFILCLWCAESWVTSPLLSEHPPHVSRRRERFRTRQPYTGAAGSGRSRRLTLSAAPAAPAIKPRRLADTPRPAQIVVEPGSEPLGISGVSRETNGNGNGNGDGNRNRKDRAVGGLTEMKMKVKAEALSEEEENQEGRGQQGFEGPEKTLEIEFDPGVGHEGGLRAIRREQWDAILEQAQCQILHHRGNEHFDSYVLSESSLFVYQSKLVLKTCGTTTLLRCLPLLTVVTKNYGLSLEWIGYSRKDFTFPTDQIYPHTSFTEEVDFLQTMFAGSACVHGPLNSDHWCTFVADDCKRPTTAAADRTLNLMMYDLERGAAENFYKSEKIQTAEDVSLQSGMRRVLPKATLHDHLFEPCGYSMNALEGKSYYTAHVTPEPDFSYASFETNVRLPRYDALVRGVLEVFRPKRFTMTLIGEDSGMEDIKESPFDYLDIVCAPTSASSDTTRYRRTIKTTTNVSGDFLTRMGNWVRAVPERAPPPATRQVA